ncbi:MAG: sensor domain-containing diguanylate cyclase, partial [Candidatus Izimaplasma sp.]|nr:sensor domain-containing diguanylate cyclase [Candidatus Izimaplasma bacterium]
MFGRNHVYYKIVLKIITLGLSITIIIPVILILFGFDYLEIVTVGNIVSFLLVGILASFLLYFVSTSILKTVFDDIKDRINSVKEYTEQKNFSELDINEVLEECQFPIEGSDPVSDISTELNKFIEAMIKGMYNEYFSRETMEAFSAELNITDLSDKILSYLMSMTNSNAGLLVTKEEGAFIVRANKYIESPNRLLESGILKDCLENQKSATVLFDKQVHIDTTLIKFSPKSIKVEPIVYKGNTLGAILIASNSAYDQTMWRDTLFLLRHTMAIGLYNAINHERIKKIAKRDPLTNTFNRNYGMQLSEELLQKARDLKGDLSILMFDIDKFKDINDTHGHQAGDYILKRLVDVIQNLIRKDDLMFRYGGDEFVVSFYGMNEDVLKNKVKLIQQKVKEFKFKFDNTAIKVELSQGG